MSIDAVLRDAVLGLVPELAASPRTELERPKLIPIRSAPIAYRALLEGLRDEVCARFGTRKVILDQHSSHAFAQLCQDVGLKPIVIAWRPGENTTDDNPPKVERYRSFRTAMCSGDLRLPDVAELLADLRACRGVLLPGGGERVEVPRSSRGHGDVLSAVVMAASEAQRSRPNLPPSRWSYTEYLERAHRIFHSGWGASLGDIGMIDEDGNVLSYPEMRRRIARGEL